MNGDTKTNWIIGIIVAFAIGLGLGWIIWGGTENPREETEETADVEEANGGEVSTSTGSETGTATTSAPAESSELGTAVIEVDDQTAGTAVRIRRVQIEDPSWVAIREDRDGALGNILGAQWLPAGTFESEEIELLRGIIPSGTYYAVIYRDDGDRVFNYKKDFLISDQNGVITAKFTAFAAE